MTKFEIFTAAEAAFDAAAQELKFARSALGRSKSKTNIARFVAAEEAFETTLASLIVARDAYHAEIENAEVIAAAEAAKFLDTQLSLF